MRQRLRLVMLFLAMLLSLLWFPAPTDLWAAFPLREVPKDAEPIVFSETALPMERAIVCREQANWFNSGMPAREHVSTSCGSTPVAVAVVDLNQHGRHDILAFFLDDHDLRNSTFAILIAMPDGHWRRGWGPHTSVSAYPAVWLLPHRTHGFRDLILTGHGLGYAVWQWDGNEYR